VGLRLQYKQSRGRRLLNYVCKRDAGEQHLITCLVQYSMYIRV
jgi:hypothetical protein